MNLLNLGDLYFNITGPDGAGKDSVLKNVLKNLENYIVFREPGGTEEAETIRKILLCNSENERIIAFEKSRRDQLLSKTRDYVEKAYEIYRKNSDLNSYNIKELGLMEAYLYAASRNETNSKLVLPNLEKGKTVIGSRSVACSISYQGNARDLGIDVVWNINKPVLTRLPDFEIYLDIPTEVAMERLSNRKEKQDRLDNENEEFHKKSREGYINYYNEYCPYKHYKVDATGTIEQNTQRVMNVLKQYDLNR